MNAECIATPNVPAYKDPLAFLVQGAGSHATQAWQRDMPRRAAPKRVDLLSGRDTDFVALLNSYRPTGGVLRADDLAYMLARRGHGDHVSLARKIVSRDILSFEWNKTFWIPAFQFEDDRLTVTKGTCSVLGELNDVFDSWMIAQWFVTSHPALLGLAPLEVLKSDLPAVLNAARSDRFIAAG